MTSIAFFNNKGGVGKTSLVYHTGWMLTQLGHRVLMVDLDPQSNLSAMSLNAERLEELWTNVPRSKTIFGAIEPLFNGTGDVEEPHVELLNDRLGLIVGHLALSRTEDDFTVEWSRCLEGKERAFKVTTAFWRTIKMAAQKHQAEFVLIDVSPNLGAINRAALLAADHIITPVTPDLFSLQGLRNLGPTLKQWRRTWMQAKTQAPKSMGELPNGTMKPSGYVLMSFSKPQDRVLGLLPTVYKESVLEDRSPSLTENKIGQVYYYGNLMPVAMETKRPMFLLKENGKSILGYPFTVRECYDKFKVLTQSIIERVRL